MRKRAAKKRPLLPDPRFNDQLVTRFVNNLMWDGKKSTAFKVFYDAIDIIETKKQDAEKSSLEIWKDALTNVMPHVEVRSRRVGGATFQIPMQIRPDRKISMAMKWLILYSRRRNEKSMAQRLASECLAAAKEEGAAVVPVEDAAEAKEKADFGASADLSAAEVESGTEGFEEDELQKLPKVNPDELDSVDLSSAGVKPPESAVEE